MKKTLILLGFLLVTAFPVLAQNHELTILAGGAKALKSFDGGKSDFQHGSIMLHTSTNQVTVTMTP